MSAKIGVAFLTMGAVLLCAPHARGEEPRATAAEFFRVGKQAFERSDFRAAALAFEEADRRAPHAVAIYNAGLAWDGAGDTPRAADGYRQALDRGGLPDALDAHARRRIDDFEKRLGLVRVHAPPGALVSVAHVVRHAPPVHVHVPPGSITVRIEMPDGQTMAKRVDVPAGEPVTLSFDDTRIVLPPPPSHPFPALRPALPPEPAAPVVPPTPLPSARPSLVWAWIAIGSAAVITGAGVFLGVRGLTARSDFDASGRTDGAARDEAVHLRTAANVAFGTAIVLGATGVVLLLTSRPKTPTAAMLDRNFK